MLSTHKTLRKLYINRIDTEHKDHFSHFVWIYSKSRIFFDVEFLFLPAPMPILPCGTSSHYALPFLYRFTFPLPLWFLPFSSPYFYICIPFYHSILVSKSFIYWLYPVLTCFDVKFIYYTTIFWTEILLLLNKNTSTLT